MCGIAGLSGRRPDSVVLGHRGPDGHAWQTVETPRGPFNLLHTRLAIVDLSDAGNQPMSGEDDRFTMVFNGEIYNHLELRDYCRSKGHTFASAMDGEVIVHLWEMEGAACLRRLNGIFTVAMVDKVTGEVCLATDPLGVKPAFYVDRGEQFAFASELSALAGLGIELGPLSVPALAKFLSFLWIPAPETPFTDVHALPPGHLLRWTPGERLRVEAYRVPQPHPEQAERMSAETALMQLRERVDAAVRRQLLGDVPISIMASGGIDSSVIWQAAGPGVAQAYTIEFASGDAEGVGEDAAAVRLLQGAIGTPVTFIDGSKVGASFLPLSGDLFADPAFDLTRMISARTRADGRKVLLSGQGGDEVFGGYRRHMIAPLLGRAYTGAVGHAAVRRLGGGMLGEFGARFAQATTRRDPFERYMELCTYSTTAERAKVLGVSEREVDESVVWARHRRYWEALPKSLSYLRKAMALDLGVYLPGLGLAYVDRASMEYGVEARVPLLDLELLEWSFTLPDELLVRRFAGKQLLKSLARQVLPPEVVDRPKRGFGVPASNLDVDDVVGDRGHRQGRYFGFARQTLDRWMRDKAKDAA